MKVVDDMAKKRGSTSVHRRRDSCGFIFFFLAIFPLFFIVSRSRSTSFNDGDKTSSAIGAQDLDWRVKLALEHVKPLFKKEVMDVIIASTNDLGPLSLVSLRRMRSSASQKFADNNTTVHEFDGTIGGIKQENTGTELHSSTEADHSYAFDTPENAARRHARKQKQAQRAAALVQQDREVSSMLEDAAIERSKSVDSAILGKYSIWRKPMENKKSDSTVRLMRDQIIMAKVYIGLAKRKNELDLAQQLQDRVKESQQTLGESTFDSELPQSAPVKLQAMGQVLSKAKDQLYDCELVSAKLRAMLHSKKKKFPRSENVENPDLYHYALFSDNVLAVSVVVNSTIMNAKEPERHVFHIVTDKLNFGAMNMWFLLNPPGESTIQVQNYEEFKWLNSSYCPVLRQLESSALREYYFKGTHPTTLSEIESDLKYRNPKYLSMLNHLRFYLPEIYPKLDKILFLDDDIVVQKDLTGLWSVNLHGMVNGAVETCGKSFHRYDKYLNFSNAVIARNFDPRGCGWAYGMNIFDLKEWKKKDITGIYHKWQNLNEERVLWKLGTLPVGLVTFDGLTHPLKKSWHVLRLGYEPGLHLAEIDKAAVIHYNGNYKPWLEFALTRYLAYWTKYVNFDHPVVRNCKFKV